jgi:hypothetical protein
MEQYRERTLPFAELIAADDHLAECADCREHLGAAASLAPAASAAAALRRDLQASLRPEHISYEQLAAYVDREADAVEREVVESHLSHCSHCVEQYEELRAFAAQLSTYPDKEYAPAVPLTLWERVRKALGLESFSVSTLALGMAGIAALLLLVLTPWVMLRREQSSPAPVAKVDGPGAAKPAPTLAAPAPQPTAEAPHPAEAPLVALNDGGREIALTRDGNLAGADGISAADQQKIKSALKSGRVVLPDVPQELGDVRRGALMGGASERTFNLVGPVAKIVATDRPVLRWQKLEGAESYRVEVSDPLDNYKEVATSPALTTNEWRVDRPLPRGHIYTWQVVAIKNGEEIKSPSPDAPEARFKVLEQAKAGEIERAKKAYGNQHLALGLAYAEAGLLEEAEREFRALVAANPSSAEAKRLLRAVQARK